MKNTKLSVLFVGGSLIAVLGKGIKCTMHTKSYQLFLGKNQEYHWRVKQFGSMFVTTKVCKKLLYSGYHHREIIKSSHTANFTF